jgi:SAM-dependent methyltransferase
MASRNTDAGMSSTMCGVGDHADSVRAYFERSAEQFDRLYSECLQNAVMLAVNRRFRSDVARRFVLTLDHAQATGARSALDIGCGSGRYLAALAQIGVERLVGIDLSGPMLDLAARHLAESAQDHRCQLVCGDFMTWATTDRFDLVVAMGFFDYQVSPLAVLRKIRDLTTGSLIASFPSRHWLRMPIRRLRYRWKRCPVYFYRREEIADLGLRAGFARTEIFKIPGAGMDFVARFWVT